MKKIILTLAALAAFATPALADVCGEGTVMTDGGWCYFTREALATQADDTSGAFIAADVTDPDQGEAEAEANG